MGELSKSLGSRCTQMHVVALKKKLKGEFRPNHANSRWMMFVYTRVQIRVQLLSLDLKQEKHEFSVLRNVQNKSHPNADAKKKHKPNQI